MTRIQQEYAASGRLPAGSSLDARMANGAAVANVAVATVRVLTDTVNERRANAARAPRG